MTNHIPRKSVRLIAAGIAVTLGSVLVAALVSQRLAETHAVTPDASQLSQYGYLGSSGEDIWHAFPTGR